MLKHLQQAKLGWANLRLIQLSIKVAILPHPILARYIY